MIEELSLVEARGAARTVPAEAKPHAFEVRGRSFLYDPEGMHLFACDAGARERALRVEGVLSARRPQFELGEATVRSVVLVLTHACNLRCRYCFHGAAHDGNDAAILSMETIRKALDLVPPGQDFRVSFFGGEPLVAGERLREAAAEARTRARQRGVGVRFSLTTNGTLLDEPAAAWLQSAGFSLIVSLDGPARLHDATRIDAAGEGSHARTLAGLEAVASHPALAARTTLRATYDTGAARLVERLGYLNDLADELGLGGVSVEPADLTEGCAGGEAGALTMTPALREEYLDAAAWFVERLREGRTPRFHHFAVRLKRLLRRTPSASECGAGCGYLTVGPDGTVYACHREGASRVGSVATGVDTALQAAWRENRYYGRNRCPGCALRNLCGGGCRWVSLARTGSVADPDPFGCALTEVCFHAAAWILGELSEPERRRLVA
jgi:uncharacterized protein